MDTPSLEGQAEVYATAHQAMRRNTPATGAGITVLFESCASALARVFALLCTLNLSPTVACSTEIGDDVVRLDLFFESVSEDRLDILLRKLYQLTECREVLHYRRGTDKLTQAVL